MATQKPISTISYNTEEFLKEKLETWLKSHIIMAYQYIKHKGEDGDKDHIHLRIEPNKKIDPMDLMEELKEYKIGEVKPLGVRPFRPSKEEDWILYAIHEKDYLNLKYGGGEKGEKIPYTWEEIKVPEYYDMEVAYIRAKSYLEHTTPNLVKKLKSGEKPMNLVEKGENPFLVNSLVHVLNNNDYTRLKNQYDELIEQLYRLQNAIENYNLEIYEDITGQLCLRRKQQDADKHDLDF